MLQCGGGNNASAALLREFFSHERQCEEHFARTWHSRGGSSARNGSRRARKDTPQGLASTGILPVITGSTDISSLRAPHTRRTGRKKDKKPHVFAFELPNHGIGFGATISSSLTDSQAKKENLIPSPPPIRGVNVPHDPLAVKMPSHGQAPPYGKRSHMNRDFWDGTSGVGIACLCPPPMTMSSRSPNTARV